MRDNRNRLESRALAGDSPVRVMQASSSSKAGHVQSCLNMGGPPSKPKYSSTTDSEQVPSGKGEKHPDEGSEIVPEIECLQAEVALRGALVPFVYWVSDLMLRVSLRLEPERHDNV